jgi:VCBS repeat-containing protein
MSKPQSIQILEEHQDLVQKLTAEINTAIGQSHYSFHVNSAERLNSGSNTEYYFKIKSNDGELYKVVILQYGDDRPAEVLSGASLYTTI